MTPRMLDLMRRVVPYVVALVAVAIVTALIGVFGDYRETPWF